MSRFVKERGDLEKEYARGLRKLVARWGKISENSKKIYGGGKISGNLDILREKILENSEKIFGEKIEKKISENS